METDKNVETSKYDEDQVWEGAVVRKNRKNGIQRLSIKKKGWEE